MGRAAQAVQGASGGQSIRILIDAGSLLVKPEIAIVQIEADLQSPAATSLVGREVVRKQMAKPRPSSIQANREHKQEWLVAMVRRRGPPLPKRFYGSTKLNSIRLSRDADRVAQEIVQHLTALVGTEVEVTLEVHAKIPDGASPELVRTVTENCRTLRFENYGFEET